MQNFEFGLLILIPASLLSGLCCAKLASNKGKNISIWAFIGSILGPLAIPIVMIQKKNLRTAPYEKVKRGFVHKLLLVDIFIVLLLELITVIVLSAAIFTGEIYLEQLSQVQITQLCISFVILACAVMSFVYRLKNPALFFFMILFLYSFNYTSGVLNWDPSTYGSDTLKLAIGKLVMLLISIRCVYWPIYTYVQCKKQETPIAPKQTEINERKEPVFTSIVE